MPVHREAEPETADSTSEAATDPEIVSAGLYRLDEVGGEVSQSLARQLEVAIEAAAKGNGPVVCENGLPVTRPL